MSKIRATLKAMTRKPTLIEQAMHVVKWNSVAVTARGGAFTPLSKQFDFLEEEYDETMKALAEGDMVEVVDGVCDMFVVASYAFWLTLKGDKTYVDEDDIKSLNNLCKFNPGVIFSLVELEIAITEEREVHKALEQVVALVHSLDINLGYNINEVLASNDSKYPTMAELRAELDKQRANIKTLSDEQVLMHEAKQIEAREGGKYSGVYAVLNEATGQYVFLTDKGKIVKPITFRKPEIIV